MSMHQPVDSDVIPASTEKAGKDGEKYFTVFQHGETTQFHDEKDGNLQVMSDHSVALPDMR